MSDEKTRLALTESRSAAWTSATMQTAEARLVQALLSQLPRPEPATAERLAALVCPCVTVKLDGTRTLVVVSSRGVHAHTMRGVRCLSQSGTSAFTALDAEEVSDHFYVFDALFVNGIDVRHLPLRPRLREAARCLPARCSLKRYYWGDDASLQVTVQRLVARKLRLADGSVVHPLEGFIFTSACASYHEPPVKFKFHTTCDFLLVRACSGEESGEHGAHRRFDLYIQKRGELERFRGSGNVQTTVSLNEAEATLLGVPPGGARREDNVIAELRLVGLSWVCVRGRPDRQRPNTLTTVMENIDIQRSGRSDARFLIKSLASRKPSPEWQARVADAMLRAVSTAAAIVAGPALGLFLPDAARLEEELRGGAKSADRKAVGLVVPPPAFEAPRRASFHALALTMDQVDSMAREFGWACKWLKSLQGKDFLVSCEEAGVSRDRKSSLDSLQFLLLCNSADGGSGALEVSGEDVPGVADRNPVVLFDDT
jgi:hypothetical protein